METAPQQTFGKYLILERIASGSMAEIYKARLDGIGGFHRFFAIKRVPPSLSRDKELVELLVEEAKIAGLLSHANIVQILDLGKIDDLYYVAMEYVDGRDLGSILDRCREKGITLPVPHSVFIAIEMLKGLEYAHQRQILRGGRPVPLNIIHRDVSPSNMLVSFQGEVKLTDFGMARAKVRAARTITGSKKGRFDYCSPEQAESGGLDQRSDLFSAGIVLYEMLCGQHPFRKAGDVQTLAAIQATQYEMPSVCNPDVPYGLEKVINRSLTQNPDDRFASASEFKSALDEFFHESGFIFSHSTLAAFLKGLFPEAKARRTTPPNSSSEQETLPFDPQQFPAMTEDTEAPTSLTGDLGLELGEHLLDNSAGSTEELETLLRRMPDSSSTGSFGPTPGPTDDATLIRKRPDHPTDEDNEDQHTQVNPAFIERPESEETKPPPSGGEPSASSQPDSDPTPVPPPGLKRAEISDFPSHPSEPGLRSTPPKEVVVQPNIEEGKVQTARRPQQVPRPSSRTQFFLVVVASICLLLGAAAGFLLGVQGSNAPQQHAVAPETPPVLQVSGPEGTQITINDDRDITLGPEGDVSVTLVAGEPTTVRAELEGYTTIELQYTLESNVEKSVQLEWATLRPRE